MALLTRARVSLPRTGWAFERFTRDGPLAVLPHPEAADQQSVVWCCTPARARALNALPTDDLSAALTHTFGTRLGTFTALGQSTIIPLRLNMRSQIVEGRCVAIGNAAQTLHPVAGQGLNLGLRDAATLALCLRDWLPHPEGDVTAGLQHFEQRRRSDRQITAGLTDSMARTFTTGWSPVEHLAGLTLLGMDMNPRLREPLARHLLQGLRR
jgi:2-octaprenyl-6-methoxyphenol hydroxylase